VSTIILDAQHRCGRGTPFALVQSSAYLVFQNLPPCTTARILAGRLAVEREIFVAIDEELWGAA
jgi:hypothetical protein